MSNSIPRDFIDRLVEDTDIVNLLGQYLSLTKKGNNYVSCCPFHEEKTPSFTISPQKSIYHCFGCGKGGNVITFLQEYEGLTFIEAIEKLAEINNLKIPRSSQSVEYDNSDIYSINQIASKHYFDYFSLNKNSEPSKYLISRGIDGETAKKFQIGFADFNQKDLLKKLQSAFSDKKILESGVFLKNEKGFYPFFRNRVIFPIQNTRGNFIGFGGRSIDDSMPKYLNSKDSNFFRKNRELYGLNHAKGSKNYDYFIVVEGYMDVNILSKNSIDVGVASLGTAFSNYHLQTLFRLKKKVVFCFDSDEAGLKAAWRALQITVSYSIDDKTVRFMFLPKGEDPDSYINKNGPNEFLKRVDKSMDIESFIFNYLKRGRNLESSEDIRLIIFEFQKIYGSIKSDALKDTLLNQFSKSLDISKNSLISKETKVKSAPKINQEQEAKKSYYKHFLLVIYLYENYGETVNDCDEDFLDFIKSSAEQEIKGVGGLIQSIKNKKSNHPNESLFAEAMMIDLKLTTEEVISEFHRVTDEIRLLFDENFIEYLKKLAKNQNLTTFRKENLQKQLNLRDNTSNQENELIQFLNEYNLN